MHASRKILLRHFDARVAEYKDEMATDKLTSEGQSNFGSAEQPVRITFVIVLLVLSVQWPITDKALWDQSHQR